MFQLILNPIRDWNEPDKVTDFTDRTFQLILNPIRDWNIGIAIAASWLPSSN